MADSYINYEGWAQLQWIRPTNTISENVETI